MSMPSSAKLSDKLVMLLQQEESLGGIPVAQIKFIYAAPLQVPAAMGQCGMFAVDFSAPALPAKGIGIFCSLPPDSAQLYKLALLIGTAPNAIAAQTLPTVARGTGTQPGAGAASRRRSARKVVHIGALSMIGAFAGLQPVATPCSGSTPRPAPAWTRRT